MSTQAIDEFPLEEAEVTEAPASLTTRRSRKAEVKAEPEAPATAQEAAYRTLMTELDKPLDRALVKQREGYGTDRRTGLTQMLDYLEWHTVVRQLNRIIGFGKWGTEVSNITDLSPDPDSGVPRSIRATVKLTVEYATGPEDHYRSDATVFENVGVGVTKPNRRGEFTWKAYDMAVKTAVHDALKRCAVNLGEQFGLGLYDKDEDEDGETEGATTSAPARAAAPAPRRAAQPSSDLEVAECQECGKEIRGYTNRQGKTYTTQDLVNMSKKATGGQILCYSCRQNLQSTRDL